MSYYMLFNEHTRQFVDGIDAIGADEARAHFDQVYPNRNRIVVKIYLRIGRQ